MTSPVKQKSLSNISEREPEVSFGVQHGAIPKSQIERRAAQACKQFRAAFVPDLSHLDNSTLSFAGSVNQQTDGKVMESFTPQKGNKQWLQSFREHAQERFSRYMRRRAASQRGFIGKVANTLSCSTSKASKLTYGEAAPHWIDPFLLVLEEDGLVPFLREVLGEDYVDAALRKEALRILQEMLERTNV